MNIKTMSFGCRLNALECEKISRILAPIIDGVILVNTCSVTGEAERQCAQSVRKLSRENPNAVIFVTGCGATRNPKLFASIPRVLVLDNADKMKLSAYVSALKNAGFDTKCPEINIFRENESKLSKQFVQVQNGCNHDCTYCVTRLLRGPNVSFPYNDILSDVRAAIDKGFYEIVLTGVDTGSYMWMENNRAVLLCDICARLLSDVPQLRRLRLSSVDPASPEVPKIIDLMRRDARFMPHLHLSMQSGADTILRAMRRRHDGEKLRELARVASGAGVSLGADIICGFPGETDDLFNETAQMVRDMNLIHVHAFPYSPRPGTIAAQMPNQIDRKLSKDRVKIITNIANENRARFMASQIGKTTSVLVEEDNVARTPDDLPVKIGGVPIANKTICDVKIIDIKDGVFVGTLLK